MNREIDLHTLHREAGMMMEKDEKEEEEKKEEEEEERGNIQLAGYNHLNLKPGMGK